MFVSNAAEAEVTIQEDRTAGVISEENDRKQKATLGPMEAMTGGRRRRAGLHMATEASSSLGRLWTTCSSCPESDTS